MFKIEDFSPIFKTPTGLLLPNGSNASNGGVGAGGGLGGGSNGVPTSGTANLPLTPSFVGGSAPYNNYSQIPPQSHQANERLLTFTNYYKFCCLRNVNCYFYQFNLPNSGAGGPNVNAAGSTYEILKYEQIIKHKLANDYQINHIITWIAKRELCLFQLQVEDPNQSFDSSVGFNQLKDAMSNIISENSLSLKLISASTFDADKIFGNTHSVNHTSQNQLQKKSLNVVYLSFLRAVHKYVVQRMTKTHSLFETPNQSLSIDILPYSGHLISSSMIQKAIVATQGTYDFTAASRKKKIMKKLVPYSILKISPSLNQKNELIINMTSLKKVFYKITDYITVTCNGSIKTLDEKSKFALYIAPSGIRCLIAGNSYLESITDEPPENYEKLFNILKTFNDIDLTQNPSLINEKRLWIKIHPIGFSSSSAAPVIANYLENTSSTSRKFIYWPLELCFIQFASDSTPGLSRSDDFQPETFTIDDPFQVIDEFVDILEDIETAKVKEEQGKFGNEETNGDSYELGGKAGVPLTPSKNSISNPERSEGRSELFPESFDFKPEIDSLDQQLKPLKGLGDAGIDNINDIMRVDDGFDDLFKQKGGDDMDLMNGSRQTEENEFQKELRNVFQNDESITNVIDNSKGGRNSLSPDKKVDSNFEEDWGDLFGDSAEEDENDIDQNDIEQKNRDQKDRDQEDTDQQDTDQQDRDQNDIEQKDIDREVDEELAELENFENSQLTGNANTIAKEENAEHPGLHRDLTGDDGEHPIKSPTAENLKDESQETFPMVKSDGPTFCEIRKPSTVSPPEQTAQELSNSVVIDTSPLYQDPGAPSPIPFQIFAPPASSSEDSSPIPAEEKPLSKPFTSLTPKEKKKSVFSPLSFNPLIEKDIDSKYSNGGKFFVKKSGSLGAYSNSDQLDPKYLDSSSENSKIQAVKSVTPVTETTFNHLANLTTPSFLMRGPGKTAETLDYSADDLISDSDDEIVDIGDDSKEENLLYDIGGMSKADREDSAAGAIENEVGATDEIEDDENEQEEKNSSDLSAEGGFLGQRGSIGFGITVPGTDGNSSKRRKLETIFDSINDDDELDFDFDDEYNDDNDNIVGDGNDDMMQTDNNKLLKSNNPENITDSRLEFDTNKEKTITDVSSIEIPNSWFYVLRPIAPIQIPFNFLQSVKLTVDSSRIQSLLPILQEYVLFSQKYMNNQMLNMLVQSRECPSVLDNDVEYLLYKIFPGICKINCYELIDSEKDSKQVKPFECLFGLNSINSKAGLGNRNGPELELKLFDENNYEPSPMLNAPFTETQSNQLGTQYMDEFSDECQKIDLSETISADNLFRINPTVLNLKRLNQDVIVNKVGISFWKMLNLEPIDSAKDFSVLFVIPKATEDFGRRAIHFLDGIVSYYKGCKLGEIQKLNDSGIIEISYDVGNESHYWDHVQKQLLSIVEELQNECTMKSKGKVLLMFVDPFQDLNSLIKMADITQTFETALVEKHVSDNEGTKKKKKRKNKTIARLPITLFYKAFAIDSFYLRDDGQFVIFTGKDYINLVLELYNNCPNDGTQMILKDRKNMFNIEKDIQQSVKFMLTKKPVAKLIEKETFLHLCYERSIDKKWCVASWISQCGKFNYTKSWYIDESIEGSQSFEKVADDIMRITMEYVAQISGKCLVIMTRLNNIIPDDELAEWKRLSMKNNDLILVVMTAELESSTLILSNNPGQALNSKKKEDNSKDLNYTVASTNSQSQTPGNILVNSNNYVHQLAGSTKFESPDVSMYTPSYDTVLSPMDVSTHQVQVPIQTLQPLLEDNPVQDTLSQNPILVDISDECYGLILQVSQPLSNQPRVPLKTGFLINTGEGTTKNRILEINLLSCQSGISTTKFLKTLLVQYRNLSSFAPFFGVSGILRQCGNVDCDESGEDEDDDEGGGSWEDYNINSSAGLGLNVTGNGQTYGNDRVERKKEKHFIQQQYFQFHRMQQRQKRQRVKERERELSDSESYSNVIPVHMLVVRKMLDFLVNIQVE